MLIENGLAWPRWTEGSDLGGRLLVSASSCSVTMHLFLRVHKRKDTSGCVLSCSLSRLHLFLPRWEKPSQ